MTPSFRRCLVQGKWGLTPRVVLAGLVYCCLPISQAGREPPVGPGVLPPAAPAPFAPSPKEPPCEAPPVPVTPPKTAAAAALVESARCNDASIEVIAGQSRILIVKEDLQTPKKAATLYVGDPLVADITFVPPLDPKVVVPRPAIRILGKQTGITDLVIQTPDDRIFKFEVRVIPNHDALRAKEESLQAQLKILNARLQELYPDASVTVESIGNNLLLRGQVRSTAQMRQILDTAKSFAGIPIFASGGTGTEAIPFGSGGSAILERDSRIINLIRVIGSQQVLLKVRVAELNRTAMRAIGADFLALTSNTAVGTSLGNSTIAATGALNSITASGSVIPGTTTAFAILNNGRFDVFLSALRSNNLLKILAEPNLVALNDQQANFLAGGQFFVPTAQTAIGGVAGGISAQAQPFGVSLDFLPHILDGDVIRLTVNPSVSEPDFTVATTLVAGGSPVPGLNIRSAHTTVELRQGQTLAIAGLMSVTLDGTTKRIPGLGDMPILGPFFSNTTGSRTEKELIVLVTPYLVEPMNDDQVPPLPGEEVKEPNDLEFYLLNRIEGRTGVDFRSTTHYDDALHMVRCLLRLHDEKVRGPKGYCE